MSPPFNLSAAYTPCINRNFEIILLIHCQCLITEEKI